MQSLASTSRTQTKSSIKPLLSSGQFNDAAKAYSEARGGCHFSLGPGTCWSMHWEHNAHCIASHLERGSKKQSGNVTKIILPNPR
jgi:hypothetical protein